jgi:hypothetical protein
VVEWGDEWMDTTAEDGDAGGRKEEEVRMR